MVNMFLSHDDDSAKPEPMIEWCESDPVTGASRTDMLTSRRAIARLIDRVIHNRRLIDQLYVDRDELRTLLAEQRQMIVELRRKLEDGSHDGVEAAIARQQKQQQPEQSTVAETLEARLDRLEVRVAVLTASLQNLTHAMASALAAMEQLAGQTEDGGAQ